MFCFILESLFQLLFITRTSLFNAVSSHIVLVQVVSFCNVVRNDAHVVDHCFQVRPRLCGSSHAGNRVVLVYLLPRCCFIDRSQVRLSNCVLAEEFDSVTRQTCHVSTRGRGINSSS